MKSGRRGLGVLLVAAAGLIITKPGAAQSIEELLGELRLEHQGALSLHGAAQTALTLIDRQFNSALIAIDRARRARDDAGRSRALSDAQARTAPLADARNRVVAAADSLRSVRQALIDVLIVRQVELIELANAAPSAQQRRGFDNLLRVVSNELAAVENDVENDALDPVAMPDIAIDPRDGPAEMLGKAQILERTAARVDTLILSIDDDIGQLESRREMERRHRDFIAGTGRFGDLQPPTGTTAGADPAVQVTDSTTAGGRPVTLDQRIEARRAYRRILLDQRDLLLFRARDFRDRVRSRS